jgi:hypothetical protein
MITKKMKTIMSGQEEESKEHRAKSTTLFWARNWGHKELLHQI